MSKFDAAQSRAAFPFQFSNRPLQHDKTAAIAVVDPDEQARAAAARHCEREGYQVLLFASAEEFLRAVPPDNLTCILLDVSTTDRQGIEVLRRLAERVTAPPVIVLTGQADIGLVVEAMKLRAIDLIEKPYQPASLLGAIGRARIQAGEIGAARQTRREAAELVERLTKRQQQVLHGIARGEPNKIIAWKLGLSVRTVEAYRAQVLMRLRARNSADAVRIAIAAGIIGGALYIFGKR
jgi:two-component system, LuxR family, response regulator FixJ